ncbi:hypothetical protein IG631_19000 [Alternaria alternata]|nr:hypothetical protein IG631_19000 [Alternaria alternata]
MFRVICGGFVLKSILRQNRVYGQSAGRSVAARCFGLWDPALCAASAAFVHVTMENLQIRSQGTQGADSGYSASRHFAESRTAKGLGMTTTAMTRKSCSNKFTWGGQLRRYHLVPLSTHCTDPHAGSCFMFRSAHPGP